MKKPVTLLTGFLGAGKTTLLNHLLQANKHIKYAIIENEFGEQGIDNELVLHPDESIVQLNNGCLCCTLNDNLYDILNELHDRRDEFDEIIIEATGVADPRGLAEPFIAHPLVKEHFPISAIVCMVDAELIEDQLEETEEAINQITYSDILFINKTDLVSDVYVKTLVQKLRKLNPLAMVVKGQQGQFPTIELHKDHMRLEGLLTQLQNKAKPNSDTDLEFPIHKPHEHHHHHHDHKHTEEVNSFTYTFEHPFAFESLHHHLFVYLMLQSKGLYRMKGLVWLQDREHQYVIQSVGKQLDFQEKRKWRSDEKKQSTIVFIGKNLKKQGLEKLLKKCLAPEIQNQKAFS